MEPYLIYLYNKSNESQYFYLFQEQASFDGALGGSKVSSSCLGCLYLAHSCGSQGKFALDSRIFAGAESTMPVPPPKYRSSTTISKTYAFQEVSLSSTPFKNLTKLTIDPLALSEPTEMNDARGTFGIEVPIYNPSQPSKLNCGNAVIFDDGSIVLSSYVPPSPNQTLQYTPKPIYFIKTGYNELGSEIEYDTSGSAKCDFSERNSEITVVYQNNGTFEIN